MADSRPEKLRIGARVRHVHADAWTSEATGTITEALPQRDGTFEYLVQRDRPYVDGSENTPSYWPSYYTVHVPICPPSDGVA